MNSVRWGPRAVDIDILMYDDLVLDMGKIWTKRLEYSMCGIPCRRLFAAAITAIILLRLIRVELEMRHHQSNEAMALRQAECLLYMMHDVA